VAVLTVGTFHLHPVVLGAARVINRTASVIVAGGLALAYAATQGVRVLGREVGECAWTARQDAIFPSGSPSGERLQEMYESGSLQGAKVEGARAQAPALHSV
jgi:hypothetical protein